MNEIQNQTDNTPQPLQIITLARAERRRKNNTTARENHSPLRHYNKSDEIRLKLKDIINEQKQLKDSKHSSTYVPTARVYSKVASRRRPVKENVTVENNVDLSLYSSQFSLLQPPSWINKPRQRRRYRPTQLDKIVQEMKERCSPTDINYQRDEAKSPKISGSYNNEYHYRSCAENNEEEEPLVFQSENPLGFCDDSSETKTIGSKASNPGFVWNPVIDNKEKCNVLFTHLGRTSESGSNNNQEVERARGVPDINDISFYENQIPQSFSTPFTTSASTNREYGLPVEIPISFNTRSVPSSSRWVSEIQDPWEEPYRRNTFRNSSWDYETNIEITISENSDQRFSYFI